MLSLKNNHMNTHRILHKQSNHHQQARLMQIQLFFQQSRKKQHESLLRQQLEKMYKSPEIIPKCESNYQQCLQIIDLPYAHLKNQNVPIQPQPLQYQPRSPLYFEVRDNILCQYGNYVVFKKLIGTGTYSRVYEGLNVVSKHKVAVKEVECLEPNEINCLLSVHSPHIIKLYDCWTHNRNSYIVLELCDSNLRQVLTNRMSVLFHKNILHRDLKFENILLQKGVLKLADFGLAKSMGQQLEVESIRCGTPYTMAPEIYFHRGNSKPSYTSKCDIWSLGVIIHELVYKVHPFDYSVDRMLNNQRVQVHKKYNYLDTLIDKSLVFSISERISWREFISIANCKGNYLYNMYEPVSVHNPENIKINGPNKIEEIIPKESPKVISHHQAIHPSAKLCESIYEESPNYDQIEDIVPNIVPEIKIINKFTPIKKSEKKRKPFNTNAISKTPHFREADVSFTHQAFPESVFMGIKTPERRENQEVVDYNRQKSELKNDPKIRAPTLREERFRISENSSLLQKIRFEGILLLVLMIAYIVML